jgi:hypothetical protein
MESAEFESSLVSELNQVLLQAAEEVASEERLDLTHEVLETVRFEQAHISWLDRLRNTSNSVELRLAHSGLTLVLGEVRGLTETFIVMEDLTTQLLINFDHVVAASGLSDLSRNHSSPDAISCLSSVWIRELIDQDQTSTWYLVGDQVIEGLCLRIGFDSLDIESNSRIFTIPKRSVVAIRNVKFD